MTDWSSNDIEANGIKIHYYRTGTGNGDKPPLILSHGASDSGLCWTRLTRALEQDYDVIMPDARGHGLSDAPQAGYANEDHAADLAGVIQALNLESKPALAGHSMGAATTLRLIADYPDLAGCAILEDPPIWSAGPPTPTPGRPGPREAIRRTVLDAQSTSDLQAFIDTNRQEHPTWADEEWQPWADAKQHVSLHFLDALQTVPPASDWRALLARVTVPTLLVTADPDRGGIVTPEAAAEATRILPSLQVTRLPGAGHNIRREQFEALLAATRAFLAAHSRASALTHP